MIDIVSIKQSETVGIILAYDIEGSSLNNLLALLDEINEDIVGLKIHNEILGFSDGENELLYNMCEAYGIFLWEDRKFNDIGATFQKQVKRYEKFRDVISVSPMSGSDILKVETRLDIFVLVEMSSRNNLFTREVSQKILDMVAFEKLSGNTNIKGIICQNSEFINTSVPVLTIKPGINLSVTGDALGQCYSNLSGDLPDMIVVGRGITNSADPVTEIQKYKIAKKTKNSVTKKKVSKS